MSTLVSLIGRTFRHYKGGVYKVVQLAKHTETNEMLVIYHDQQNNHWARPADMFGSYVKTMPHGDWTKRFVEMEDDSKNKTDS